MASATSILKYFPAGHPELAARLDRFLRELGAKLEAEAGRLRAVALVLGGGYGRGEGGVFVDTHGKAHLYNDLEFYLFSSGPPTPALRRWAEQAALAGEREFAIDVEIKVLPLSWLETAGPSMFLHDLVAGHRMVFGPADFLRSSRLSQLREPALIPLHEATRLLFNRGSGLLFSAAKLDGTDPEWDPGFLQRNHAKVCLALGDAVLVVNRLYQSSARERERRLATGLELKPPCWAEVQMLHGRGLDFKFNPQHEELSRDELRAGQRSLTSVWSKIFLWVESHRLCRAFGDLADYAGAHGRLLPEFCAWKNILLRWRDHSRYKEALPDWLEYPRALLQRALAAFLRKNDGSADYQAGGRILRAEPADAFETYRRWWARYN